MGSETVTKRRKQMNAKVLLPLAFVAALVPLVVALGGTAGAQVGAWGLTGNANTNPNTDFLGTTDNVPFSVRVNNQRALRIDPNAISPNLIGGFGGNSVLVGVTGATLSGGGSAALGFPGHRVTDNFGTIGGGDGNQAGD